MQWHLKHQRQKSCSTYGQASAYAMHDTPIYRPLDRVIDLAVSEPRLPQVVHFPFKNCTRLRLGPKVFLLHTKISFAQSGHKSNPNVIPS